MIQEIGDQYKKEQVVSVPGVRISEEDMTREAIDEQDVEFSSPEGAPTEENNWNNADQIKYMVDHTSDAYWQMDKDFKFTYTNAACEKITGGFKDTDFVGKSLLEFLTPEGIERLMRLNGSRRESEAQGIKTDVIFCELQMKRKDGTYFWAGISSSPRRDSNGNLIGYQGIIRDFSSFSQYEGDRERLEELLKKEAKMAAVGEMVGGIAHELNNVMVGILGYSELLMFQADSDIVDLHKHVSNIIESGERATAIVQDLMTMSRNDGAGRKPVNLNDLVPACLKKKEFRKLSEQYPGITLNLDLEPSLHDVSGSFPQLEKSIMNLLSLSLQQAGLGREVREVSIATRTVYLGRPINGYDNLREGEYVVLSITDTGDGISDGDVGHIFEPFYIKKVMQKGLTGLELTVARAVIKDHNGFIDVRSKIGCGATFTIYLPVSHGEISGNSQVMSQAPFNERPKSIN